MAIDKGISDVAHEAKAHTTLLLLALPAYTVHFKSPTYLQIHTLDLIDNKCLKTTLKETAGATSLSAKVREAIGGDGRYWAEMREVADAGVRGLERRSFANNILNGGDNGTVDYESTSGALIASNYPGLWKDLERLNDLISISRNLLTIGALAQGLAATYTVEHAIFKLINCCVRVTARGYDGGGSTGDAAGGDGTAGRVGEEEKWQWIVNAYKKLLITCLQWLNNFAAGNERAKLNVWGELFDSASDSLGLDEEGETGGGQEDAEQVSQLPSTSQTKELVPKSKDIKKKDAPPATPKKPSPPITTHDILLAYGTNGSSRISPLELQGAIPLYSPPAPNSTPSLPLPASAFKPLPTQIQALAKKNHYDANGYVFFTAKFKGKAVEVYQRDHGRSPTLGEIHLSIPVLWEEERGKQGGQGVSAKKMWEMWQGSYDRAVREYHDEVESWEKGLLDDVSGKRTLEAPAVEVPLKDASEDGQGKTERQRVKKIDVEAKVKALEEKIRADLKKGEWMEVMNVPASQAASSNGQIGLSDHSSTPSNKDATSSTAQLGTTKSDPLTKSSEKDNTTLIFDAQAGVKILESGKAELMKRLEGFAAESAQDNEVPVTSAGERPGGRRRRRRERQSLSDAFNEMGADVPAQLDRKNGGDDNRPLDADSAREERAARSTEPSHEHTKPSDAPDNLSASISGSENDLSEDDNEESDEEDDEEEEEEEDEEEEEEDYPGSSEDGRGLLTDVPLILGPSEIEVLPMLVMSGIYASSDSATDLTPLTTHLLLTRTPGRNLLRELLIFVAAWDLREEELYFKFMLKIVEKIMGVGLLPYLYWSLRDRSRSRDVISPAQAVVLKLATSIFRQRRALQITQTDSEAPAAKSSTISPTDLHLLNFLFSEFRQHIIPQTCALIFLQGQIHRGRASAEDFPLNLWDMERMYEGVYQVLEFFAVCVEEVRGAQADKKGEEAVRGAGEGGMTWKGILSEWEMASELITLLRELESGIPKLGAPAPVASATGAASKAASSGTDPRPTVQQRSLSADDAAALVPTVADRADVESNILPPLPSSSSGDARSGVFEAETPLAYPEDNQPQHSHPQPSSTLPTVTPAGPPSLHDQDEPSDFEWRNLKKLTVLVLSSLIWKNEAVQDQVRSFGGLEALVAACRPDEHNPYIREHAIMCLRFAVEGNEKNAGVIREMAKEFAASSASGSAAIATSQACGPNSEIVADMPTSTEKERKLKAKRERQMALLADGLMEGHRLGALGEKEVAMLQERALATVGRNLGLRIGAGTGGEGGMEGNVPREVLDEGKYETFTDRKGQVGLRRREDNITLDAARNRGDGTASAPPIPSAADLAPPTLADLTAAGQADLSSSNLLTSSTLSGSTTKMTAEKAAELMQNALRDLPLGEKLVTDRQKAEALARLDRAFERTERSLGGGNGHGEGGEKKVGG